MKKYKKCCNELETPVCKQMKEYFVKYEEDQEFITKIHLWEEMGWQGVKALMDALMFVDYKHTFSLRLWKTYCEDEGVRHLCYWLAMNKTVRLLELLENRITALGCEFIGRVLHPDNQSPIHTLKLDHNDIGAKGVANLVEGISMNKTLQYLSLTYCNIDHLGARPLFELLIYSKSQLKELNLTGNRLRNEGIPIVMKGLAVNKSLSKIYLADNQFGEEEQVLESIKFAWHKNTHLGKYDFKFNALYNVGVEKLTEFMETATHIFDVEVSERVDREVLEKFKERAKANKPKKKKKGRKGKSKKKKKR